MRMPPGGSAGPQSREKTGGSRTRTYRYCPSHAGSLRWDMSIEVKQSVTIGRPAEELYERWRDLTHLPELMRHLESVTLLGGDLSRWVAAAPGGGKVQWDAQLVQEVPGEVIAWRSVEGSEVPNEGVVRFLPAPAGQGTEVKVRLFYDPPLGTVGKTVARLFGEEPSQQVREDLKRFKQEVETGEVATVAGRPAGPKRPGRQDGAAAEAQEGAFPDPAQEQRDGARS